MVLSKGVDEGKILFLSLIAAPEGIHVVCKKFPRVKVITSEIDEGIDESTFQVIPGVRSIPGSTDACVTVLTQLQKLGIQSAGLVAQIRSITVQGLESSGTATSATEVRRAPVATVSSELRVRLLLCRGCYATDANGNCTPVC